MRQSGFLPSAPQPQDYKLGAETTIKGVKRTRAWKPYAPTNEKQSALTFDTLSCTSFSYHNHIEFQINYMLEHGEFPAQTVAWLKDNGYFDSNGKLNFSDRFLAIMSGTTERGNDFRTVCECARTIGLIPEADLPFGGTNQKQYLDKSLITGSMLAKARSFLEHVSLPWEWLFFDNRGGFYEQDLIDSAIEESPIQIGITTPATHATTLAGFEKSTTMFDVYDTYEPFWFRNTGDAYNPQSGLRVFVSPVKVPAPTPTPEKEYVFTKVLVYGSRGSDVVMLQRMLINLGFMKAGLDTGNFFGQTLKAVKNFQTAYGIIATGNVAKLTNAKLNQLMHPEKELSISPAGIAMLKKFEGLGDGNRKTSILEPYQDQVGYWTIGYGNRYINGKMVTKNTPAITEAEADALLRTSVVSYENTVRNSISVPLTQNQYDALCSFCFNLGSLLGLSAKINGGTIKSSDFLAYVYASGVKLPVLVSRRQQEADYYFKK